MSQAEQRDEPALNPLLQRMMHLYWRVSRGMTLGVRGIVLDDDERVLLVRHTYVKGWHLPGGGVEPGETCLDALRRELAEEGRIRLAGEPALHGIFFNGRISRRDHVAVYVVRDFVHDGPRERDREIAEAAFFALDALPEGTTRGTRARLAEVRDDGPLSATW